MLAYHNDPNIKSAILAQLEAHAKADEIVQGVSWDNGKGCAVGCTLHSYNHMEYETRFGIPVMLARLEDCIFEGLPNNLAKDWPIKFLRSVKVGSNLSLVGWKFLHWILTTEEVNPGINDPLVKDAVLRVAEIVRFLAEGKSIKTSAAWSAVKSAARSAESAAWSAVKSAVESAAWSAWSAAKSAAESAASAESAESAAWSAQSARSAAQSAAWSAQSAAQSAQSAESAAQSAWSAAWSAESAESAVYIKMSEKLLNLISKAV